MGRKRTYMKGGRRPQRKMMKQNHTDVMENVSFSTERNEFTDDSLSSYSELEDYQKGPLWSPSSRFQIGRNRTDSSTNDEISTADEMEQETCSNDVISYDKEYLSYIFDRLDYHKNHSTSTNRTLYL